MSKVIPEVRKTHTVAFDFDGVFTDNKVWVDQDGKESVRCDRSDGLAFDFVRAYQKEGILQTDFIIISKESNPVVLARADKLKLKCFHGIKNKVAFMNNYLCTKRPGERDAFEGLIYFGNDLNDLPLMRLAGFCVAPQDAHPLVLADADMVIEKRGGEGCVREFIEKFLKIDLLTREELNELISNC